MHEEERPYQPRYHAARTPDALAYRMCTSGESVTFAELEARANQGAHLLRTAGIGVGDHIAILMENRREFLEICFAADRAGAYYTTISTHLTQNEITYIVRDCAARVVIGSDRFSGVLDALRSEAGDTCAYYMVGAPAAGFQDWSAAAAQQREPAGVGRIWKQSRQACRAASRLGGRLERPLGSA